MKTDIMRRDDKKVISTFPGFLDLKVGDYVEYQSSFYVVEFRTWRVEEATFVIEIVKS